MPPKKDLQSIAAAEQLSAEETKAAEALVEKEAEHERSVAKAAKAGHVKEKDNVKKARLKAALHAVTMKKK
jgi:hypothetical protein